MWQTQFVGYNGLAVQFAHENVQYLLHLFPYQTIAIQPTSTEVDEQEKLIAIWNVDSGTTEAWQEKLGRDAERK